MLPKKPLSFYIDNFELVSTRELKEYIKYKFRFPKPVLDSLEEEYKQMGYQKGRAGTFCIYVPKPVHEFSLFNCYGFEEQALENYLQEKGLL